MQKKFFLENLFDNSLFTFEHFTVNISTLRKHNKNTKYQFS